MIVSNKLIQKHKNYVDFTKNINEETGIYWNRIQKDFSSELTIEGWKNLGKHDFFPIKSNNSKLNDQQIDITINSINLKNNNKNNSLINNRNFFELLKKNCLQSNTNKVLEIGAGCGILASLIINHCNSKYFIIDIPNMIINSSSYLMTIFPDKKFCLPNEIKNSNDFIENDIIFLLPSQKNLLEENFFDLGINNQYFMEMDLYEVENYFKLIKKTLNYDSFFFTSNRLRKETYFFDYPWYILDNFEIKLFNKNKFHSTYKNNITYFDKILLKKNTKKKLYNLNLFKKILLKNSYSLSERLFWLKKDIKKLIRKYIIFW